jgi:hypothetical protein
MQELSSAREHELLTLFEERNSRARALGFPHYGEAILSLSGLAASEFFDWCYGLERQTKKAYDAFLDECGIDADIRPTSWNIPYVSRRRVQLTDDDFPGHRLESCLWSLVADLGFEVKQVQERLGLTQVYSLPGGLDGLCAIVSVPDDIRVATSLRSGYRQYEVVFHESGHALHKAHIDAPSFTFRRQEPECFNEGMAYTLQSFLANEEWLHRALGHTPSRAREIASLLQHVRLVALKYAIAQAHFEYRAYESPSGNLRVQWLESYAQHLSVDDDGIAPWAANPALVYQPLWTPSYIVGSMIASQVLGSLCQSANKTLWLHAANTLVAQCYRPGAALPWQTKIRNATGNNLSVGCLAEEICRYHQS